MPLAIGIGMSLITALFVLTNIAYSVVLSVVEIQESDAVAMVCLFIIIFLPIFVLCSSLVTY